MKVSEQNYKFLQELDWDKALYRLPMRDGQFRLTITVDEADGKIRGVSKNTLFGENTIFAGLKVSSSGEASAPVYSLELEPFGDHQAWEVVKEAIAQFNEASP